MLLCDAEAVDCRGNTAVDCDLKKNFFDVVLAQAVLYRALHVNLDLVWSIQSRQHCQIEKTAGLLIESGSSPHGAPAILRHEFLHWPIEVVRGANAWSTKLRTEHLLANAQSFFKSFLVHESLLK
jgi:hypothetical protein